MSRRYPPFGRKLVVAALKLNVGATNVDVEVWRRLPSGGFSFGTTYKNVSMASIDRVVIVGKKYACKPKRGKNATKSST